MVLGGKGGHGNKKHPSVKLINHGASGATKQIYLELKCLADLGLVGFPNAGKSTLLAALTRALPKIANYPFTTLNPNFGALRFIDNFQFSIADIPGIIKDAHQNKGLGLEFLRHIQRTKVLVYVLDISSDSPLMEQYVTLREELRHYDPTLL